MVKSQCFLNIICIWIVSSLNHIQLPLFMINKLNVTLLRLFLGLYFLSKLIIWLTDDVFLTSLLFKIVSKSHSFTSVHDQYGKCYIIKTVFRLVFSIQASYMVNSRCFPNIIII